MPDQTTVPIRITADTSGYDKALGAITRSTEKFGDVFSNVMRSSILSGRDLDDTLRSIAQRFASQALDRAFDPVDSLFSSLLGSLGGGNPTSNEIGGSNGAASAANIIFNVSSPDASGFKKSQSQISGMLVRAVQRGQRSQ